MVESDWIAISSWSWALGIVGCLSGPELGISGLGFSGYSPVSY